MMINSLRSKYHAIWVLLVLVLLNSCNDKNSVLIRVKIKSSKDSKVYLDKLDFSKSTCIDSVEVSEGEDNFSFRAKSVTEPTFFALRVKDKGAITLLSDPGEKMNLIINADKLNDYSVLGSKGSLKTKELTNKLSETKSKLYSLKLKYNLAQEPVVKSMIEQEYNAAIDSQRAYNSRFIWTNAMSRASVMAVYQKYDDNTYVLDRAEDLVLFKAVASTLKALYPNSNYTKGMIAEIHKIEGIIRGSNINSIIDQSVTTIPDIVLPNPHGDIVKLSMFKGKVILLDFWVSWDQTSLMDNRELLNIYRQFKSKGFEIYQISLDTNRDEWVNAIESANLPWVNVSELNPKGSTYALTYNITQLPANYLIGRNHTIIGKNLFGNDLVKKLREVL
ncbi:MAG: AhpC/TSA family protein [Bacteroidales bacterium]|nr:AhpC/TSA family protein [Bacteroidales bacterium]